MGCIKYQSQKVKELFEGTNNTGNDSSSYNLWGTYRPKITSKPWLKLLEEPYHAATCRGLKFKRRGHNNCK